MCRFLNIFKSLLLTGGMLLLFSVNVFGQEISRKSECESKQICASTTTAVAASYATLGYWSLGGMLNKLGGVEPGAAEGDLQKSQRSYLSLWGALIYIISIISAMIMMALGQPPKMYGWFAAGPALFYFLLFNTVERKGVGWDLVHHTTAKKQEAVWNLSVPGLAGNSLVGGLGADFASTGPSQNVKVPFVFAMVDQFASETAQNFIDLMGVKSKLPTRSGGDPDGVDPSELSNWNLLTNDKWPLMENITQSKFFDNDLRELLVIFMASECGDLLAENINKSSFIQASQSNGRGMPQTLFCENPALPDCSEKEKIVGQLDKTFIPTPYVLKQILRDTSSTSLIEFAFKNSGETPGPDFAEQVAAQEAVNCSMVNWIVMQGFRWEAALSYMRIKEQVRNDSNILISNELIDYTFLYEWTHADPQSNNVVILSELEKEERRLFLQHLIMFYMMRNELSLVPEAVEQRILPSDKVRTFAEGFQRNINSKNKFAEFYTWAKLMPHMQGLILYILAIGYPLACVVILMPGWWKWLFTWISFFIWVKSWDVGFAIVMNIEKSVWSNIGNSLDTSAVNYHVFKWQSDFKTTASCSSGNITLSNGDTICGAIDVSSDFMPRFDQTFDLLEGGMLLSRVLNHDLANSYYIYLMSALYFAVPTLTGQIFLGAKAGIANFVGEAVKGVSSEGGAAAKSGATAEIMQQGNLNTAAAEQTFSAKGLRQDPNSFALRSLQSKNEAERQNLKGSLAGEKASQVGQAYQMFRGSQEEKGIALGLGNYMARNAVSFVKGKGMGAIQDVPQPGDLHAQAGGDTPGPSVPTDPSSNPNTGNGMTVDPTTAEGRGRFWHKAANLAEAALQTDKQGELLKMTEESNKYLQNQLGTASQSGITSFAAGAMAKGYGETAQRFGAKANYEGREAAYRSQASFARQIAGNMSAMGVVAGAYDPKDKPKDMDTMGAGGLLGSSYSKAYSFFGDDSKQGYLAQVTDAKRGLIDSFGKTDSFGMAKTPEQLRGTIYQRTPGDQTASGIKHGAIPLLDLMRKTSEPVKK